MKDVFKKVCEEKILACIYKNKQDTERFYVGYIKKVVVDKILVEMLDADCKPDGFIVLDTKNIYLIEVDNAYISDMIQKGDKQTIFSDIDVLERSGDLMKDFIYYVMENNYIAEIELINSSVIDIRGVIEVVKDDYIEIEVLDENDEYDGKAYCRIEDISTICIDALPE